MRWYVKPVLAALLLGIATTSVQGQVPTGRQRTVAAEPDEASRGLLIGDSSWFFAAGIGVFTAGNLLKVDSDGTRGYWQTPEGLTFFSSHFVIVLDEDIDMSITAGRRLGDRVWLRSNLSTAQVRMRARARIGQNIGFYGWDQMSLVVFGLDVEYRLVVQDHFPFLLAGGGGVVVRGSRDESVDQTRPALRFGGGYHYQINEIFGLRAEIRNSIAALDFGGFQPSVFFPPPGEESPVIVKGFPTHHFWQILVLIQACF